jgi:hypothetical protein
MLLAALTADTQLILPIGLVCALLTTLCIATWRLANFVRDLRDEVRSTWSFRDQEQWALQLERENRHRNIPLFVPDVKHAPKATKEE